MNDKLELCKYYGGVPARKGGRVRHPMFEFMEGTIEGEDFYMLTVKYDGSDKLEKVHPYYPFYQVNSEWVDGMSYHSDPLEKKEGDMQYYGGKSRQKKRIMEFLKKKEGEHSCYIEPFCGSLNTMIHSEVLEIKNRYAYDGNRYLVSMWNAILSGWEPPSELSEKIYKDIRENKDNYPPYLVGFVGFGLSFAGKWFSGYAKSRGQNFCEVAINSINRKVKKINFSISHALYNEIYIPKNAIVYCDPPYDKKSKSCYGIEFDQNEFWEWVRINSSKSSIYISSIVAPTDFDVVYEFKRDSHADSNRLTPKSIHEKIFKYKEEL